MNLFERTRDLIKGMFKVDLEVFIEAIRISPNTQGYILGAISEYLLKLLLESQGYELLRIMEKWKGTKVLRHHGDFYIRKKGSTRWYVLESKGLKSNSEGWHGLNKKPSLIRFLKTWNKTSRVFSTEKEIKEWCEANFESDLKKLRVKVLETHFVAGRSKQRKIATSRNDEFDYVAVDLKLRTGKHEFIFARPTDLPPSKDNPKHLQQNYVIDVMLQGKKEYLSITPPWYRKLDEIFDESKASINENDMQIDDRVPFRVE